MANEKRARSGKFAPNPNSRRQRAKREKEAREAAAKAAGATATTTADHESPAKRRETAAATPVAATVGDSERTDNDGAGDGDNTADNNETISHVEEMFPNPPKANGDVKTPDAVDDGTDDIDDTADGAPRKSRAQRKRSKMLSEQLIKASDGLFGTYIKFRHPWIAQIMAQPNLPPEMAAMKDLASLTETEKDVLIESLARYIEENNIELSPGAELAMMFGGMFGMRIVTLEGIRFAATRNNNA